MQPICPQLISADMVCAYVHHDHTFTRQMEATDSMIHPHEVRALCKLRTLCCAQFGFSCMRGVSAGGDPASSSKPSFKPTHWFRLDVPILPFCDLGRPPHMCFARHIGTIHMYFLFRMSLTQPRCIYVCCMYGRQQGRRDAGTQGRR
jgi:hypothetical protein